MSLRRSLIRALCTWFTCVLLGVVAAPTVSARAAPAAEIVAEARVRHEEQVADAERAVRVVQPATSACEWPLFFDQRAPARGRPTADESAPVVALYLQHCALLL
jgi:hypothetical protein